MAAQSGNGSRSPYDVGAAADDFLRHGEQYTGYAPLTLPAYSRDLRRFQEFLEEYRLPTDIRELQTKHVQLFANSLAEYESSTIRRVVYTVSSMLGHCRSIGLINANPADGVLLPKKRQGERVAATADQCRALLAVCETPQETAVILFLATTGARRGEVLSLNVADLSADLSEVRIVGKGGDVRTMPLPEQTQVALRDHLDSHASVETPAPLFLNKAGKRMTETTIARLLRKLKHSAGLADCPFSLHSFRHGFATQLLTSGSDVESVRQLMGHRDLNSTMIYLHTNAERKRAAVESLPDYAAPIAADDAAPRGGE